MELIEAVTCLFTIKIKTTDVQG